MSDKVPRRFDVTTFLSAAPPSHNSLLGLEYRAHGADWVELLLPYQAALVGDIDGGILASGPILAAIDMATGMAVWHVSGALRPTATLDLRIDYLRPAIPGRAVIARGECYRTTRAIAFTRGVAHDGDPDDPVAHVASGFMFTDLPA